MEEAPASSAGDNAAPQPPPTLLPPFKWAVIGAGPCGIVAVALLVEDLMRREKEKEGGRGGFGSGEEKTNGGDIAWIDQRFQVGDLARWREVPSNSSIQSVCSSFAAVPSLNFQASQRARRAHGERTLIGLLEEEAAAAASAGRSAASWCELGLVADALLDATSSLLSNPRVVHVTGLASSVELSGGGRGLNICMIFLTDCAGLDRPKFYAWGAPPVPPETPRVDRSYTRGRGAAHPE